MKTAHKVGGGGAIVLACAFIAPWEGLWTTAQVDTIGTGHPVTYCYGMTNEAGQVYAGEKFTPKECSDLLAKTLPKYWNEISPCIHVAVSDKVKAALISGAYNAGARAMCRSPMVAKINAGDVKGGCQAFSGWYVHASGRIVKGLINRRNGEKQLCLEGVNAPKPQESVWTKILNFIRSIFSRR